jgi:hypothetical protein
MKIFKFYPARFERMYFVAEDIAHAKTMGDILFEKYISDKDWMDEEDIMEAQKKFFIGFEKFEHDNNSFVDSHY